MRKAIANLWPLLVLAGYYFFIGWLIYHPPAASLYLTGAGSETRPIYGFWSGFGGTLIFSAAVLFPPWYYRHTCHDHFSCLRWGKYSAAGGIFKTCKVHYPDQPKNGESHRDWLHRLHRKYQ